jgi:hypothetical protein
MSWKKMSRGEQMVWAAAFADAMGTGEPDCAVRDAWEAVSAMREALEGTHPRFERAEFTHALEQMLGEGE